MRNLTLLTDFYEITMGYGFFKQKKHEEEVVFDIFFRQNKMITYSLFAGLEQAMDYLLNWHFSEDDIAYLRSLNTFDEEFLEYLKNMRFTGDVYAVKEGEPVFPGEPILTIKAPLIQAQFAETALLNIINHQTLIATKAAKICRAAQGGVVMEFGLRRAQGPDAGIYGARAAIIGGCRSTSNVITGQMFDVPVAGTMAHSWVMDYASEYEAFKAYAKVYPDNCLLLVDTYDTLHSGIPNAIRVFKELRAEGHEPVGIRLDSGDIAYLSRKAREMLDEAGWETATITVSNSLDEYIIRDMWMQDAKIDSFGVGERLITARSEPVFGCVYKLVAVEDKDGNVVPKIKISENVGKITTPHFKKLYRFYGRDTGKAIADYLCVYDETVDDSDKMTIFDPEATWKRKEVYHFEARELLVPIFKNGELVYKQPSLEEIRAYCAAQVDTLWDEVKRFDNPHRYYVDLSQKLYDIKQELLTKNGSH